MGLFHDKREDSEIIVPASCFDVCGDARTEAQRTGTKPELCTAGSAFRDLYEACRLCVVYFQGKSQPDTIILPKFQHYIDCCTALVGLPPLPPFPSINTSSTTTRPSPATTYLEHSPTTLAVITSTSTLPQTTSQGSEPSDISQPISIPTPITTTSCLSPTLSPAPTTPITTNIPPPEKNTPISNNNNNTITITTMISIIVGVLLLFLLGMAYWSRRVKRTALLNPPRQQQQLELLGGRPVLFLNPQGSLQEMGEHHGYDELDVPRVWYELDARSLRSLNRSLKWAMSGARSPRGNDGQNGGDIAPEVGVREGV
ncbi:hypothetical protein QC764_406790 [Podospora pseudoanserina]|uniref:Uncharacterized protein n=1 Tax=Podospora pseudoanserina TaxID=2609844 RepID=A0ABR0IA87_9PEZI|nr:hypothetical protein QC764_406790 [Podospora pseudoanserina]